MTPRGFALTSVPAVFAAVAERMPERTAIVCRNTRLSYAALRQRATGVAAGLHARGVGPGQTVGLYAQRLPATIAAILGILECGASYVPFDPAYPHKLLRYLYEDSAPTVMLIQPDLLEEKHTPSFWNGEALDLSAAFTSASTTPTGVPDIDTHAPAYVMYTSGSTGRPKGVVVAHRAILRLVLNNHYARLDPEQVLLQMAPLSFDASTFEIWGALLNGGCLAMLPDAPPTLDQISAAIAEHSVTTVWLTAGLFHLMVDHQLQGLKPLRQLLAGGDVLSPSHVARALQALPNCRLINGYGPTENTTFSCCYTIPQDQPVDGPIPIGVPIAQTEIQLLDEAQRPVADGVAGELYVGGAGLALGYLNRPELTRERFVAHPFDHRPGVRLYRTGDRVRRRADGNLEFLGRVDRQIKIDGKRVELDEIEARLRANRLIGDAAVISEATGTSTPRIIAFVTAADAGPFDAEALRSQLLQELPAHMVPARFSLLDALPLSPTGKVDRRRLQPVATATAAEPEREETPRSEVEAELLRIWRQVLGTQSVDSDANFFDLGGTSLQLITIHALVRNKLKSDLSLVDLFSHQRVRALAQWIGTSGIGTSASTSPTPAPPVMSARERANRQAQAMRRARLPQPEKHQKPEQDES